MYFLAIFSITVQIPGASELFLFSLLIKGWSYPLCPFHPSLVVCVSVFVHCDHHFCAPSLNPRFTLSPPMSFLGSGCAFPPHSAPPYHNHNFHYPPSSPALLVHTECPRDYPLDDTIHHSVLHMPHHLGITVQILLILDLSLNFFLAILYLVHNI